MGKKLCILLILILFVDMLAEAGNINYLALGDSYTVGEGVSPKDSYPYQLVKKIRQAGFAIDDPQIIAKTGWRCDNLQTAIQEKNIQEKYDLVTVLIGVNNQFQNKPIENFKSDFRKLLNTSIELGKYGKSSVFVLSIPDYGCTPFGKIEREQIAKEIDTWNHEISLIANEFELTFLDITPISKRALTEENLTCKDNLHPSARMYSLWVDEIYLPIKNQLKDFLK